MTDPATPTTRKLPEYGEYATPAEQADAMGIPLDELTARTTLPKAAESAPSSASPVVRDEIAAETGQTPHKSRPVTPLGRRSWDTTLTLALLFVGVYMVFSSFASFSNLSDTLVQVYKLNGYEAFTSLALANSLGMWLNIIQPIILAVVVVGTLVSLRRGRISFWIPLSGGILSTLIVLVFLAIAILVDPAFASSMQATQ